MTLAQIIDLAAERAERASEADAAAIEAKQDERAAENLVRQGYALEALRDRAYHSTALLAGAYARFGLVDTMHPDTASGLLHHAIVTRDDADQLVAICRGLALLERLAWGRSPKIGAARERAQRFTSHLTQTTVWAIAYRQKLASSAPVVSLVRVPR